ncbi:OB-fold putative lipoprotein [Cupriavidus agavae]|uniref:Putative nucleic acid binding protein n=1 Tax=Cupriavidus agavae TaxID=1001822 RepID=A0A4Q7RYP7_9BURK|nr:OB-fold putative lipoprotein [Cupriavidus agavae]RZT38457.1 putative nucleic acid binding protein [Cupriavidus agavae]
MLSRTRQTLVAVVAVVVLILLWFVGNDKADAPPADSQYVADAPEAPDASAPAIPASIPRGIPRNGTLDPISIDENRPADILPQVAAESLASDYRDNAGAADDRYRGKYIIVEGVASGIRRDQNHVYLEIRTDNPGVVVRGDLLPRQICGPGTRACEVEARATMVRRGQKVAVECNGAGVAEDGTPLLSDCLLRGGAN